MKTKLSRTSVENCTCWNLLGICYWCRFFIRGIFVATKQYANSIQPNCKNRTHPTPSCSLMLEIPFSSFPGVFVKRDGVNMHKSWCDCCCPELFSPQATRWVGHTELFLGGQRALGWSFWMILWWALRGNLWWVLPVTSAWWTDCVVWVARLVLFSRSDSHHPGLPRGHPAAEGRPGGLLHEHPEHCTAGPEVSPGPSMGYGGHTYSFMCCPRVLLS